MESSVADAVDSKVQGQARTAPVAREPLPACVISAQLLMCMMDEIDYGLLLIDAAARLRFANQAALRECASGLSIRLQDGAIAMNHAADQVAFLRGHALAQRGMRSLLPLRSPSQTLTMAMVPLAGTHAPETLLLLGKKSLCEPVSVELFAQANGLSVAEGVVLRALCNGKRPGEVALDVGVAISTVRTHICNIRAKTGSASIRELIFRVTALPPMVAMLHRERLRRA